MLAVSVIAAAGLVPAVKGRMEGLSDRGQTVCLGITRALSLGLLVLAILNLARGGFNPFIYFQF